MLWQTTRRKIALDRPLVMAILNVTPDSFSDGGAYASVDAALRHVESMIGDGADIIDIGGESTRPGSAPVSTKDEIGRTSPIIEAVAKRFDTPISIDTTKSAVATAAIEAGAEIVNDISGLRFDEQIAVVAAREHAGLVLMHSRGRFETMHSEPPVDDIFADVRSVFANSVSVATANGVGREQIVLDVGVGFGKTQEQNLDLLAKLDNIVCEFHEFPMLVGVSRKSFIGKVTGNETPADRLGGSLAAALIAVRKGANILRVHDVGPTVQALRVAAEIGKRSDQQ